MLTQSSPLYAVEVRCPCAVDDESPQVHEEIKQDFVTCAKDVLFYVWILSDLVELVFIKRKQSACLFILLLQRLCLISLLMISTG